MNNLIRSTTAFAMHMVRPYAPPGSILIDATCGNGHDTLQLARLDPDRLFAFDVQEEAVSATENLLREQGYAEALDTGRFRVLRSGHERMADCFRDQVPDLPAEGFAGAILFNLGYLPGGDKTLTTNTETTLSALRQAMTLLRTDGLICITLYSGHPEGKQEKTAVLELAESLDARAWHVSYIQMLNQKKDPPEILLITRKK